MARAGVINNGAVARLHINVFVFEGTTWIPAKLGAVWIAYTGKRKRRISLAGKMQIKIRAVLNLIYRQV